MNKKILLSLFVLSIFIGGIGGLIISNVTDKAEASVNIGQGYQYKVASTSSASGTVPYVIRGGSGILGSIIVGTPGSQPIRIYDNALATSTATSTLIGTIKASASEQTFTFDVNVVRGIVLDIPAGFDGVYTVTYR